VKRLARILLAAAAALAVTPALVTGQAADAVRLTVLHTNDTHGHLLPFSYPNVTQPGAALAAMRERRDIGGIARRASLVARIRTEARERSTAVWLIDAGDFSDGTPFSTEFRGEADVAAMNAIGYDYSTFGNHEFNYPLAQTKRLIALSEHPVLCANAVDRTTGQLLTRAALVERIGPVRVGLFGLITRETASYPAAREGVDILDEVETARRMVAELRARADVIVLISHAGDRMDERLAAEVPGIDVIIGGHSHSRLPSGEFVWRSEDLRQDEVNGTVIVQAHQWAGELGRLDLIFERTRQGAWRVGRYRARLIPVTSDVRDDPAVADVVGKYWNQISARYGEVIGQAGADFASRNDDEAEYHLVADAVRDTMGAEIDFENSGGVRSPLVAGQITRGDLIAMDPFGNTIITFKITGRELKDLLQRVAPPVSGIRYRLQDGVLVEATVGGKPIEDDRIYSGVTNSYAAERDLKGIETTNTGRSRLDVLVEYVRSKGTVYPAYDGRRVVIGPFGTRRQ